MEFAPTKRKGWSLRAKPSPSTLTKDGWETVVGETSVSETVGVVMGAGDTLQAKRNIEISRGTIRPWMLLDLAFMNTPYELCRNPHKIYFIPK
jgi:hypothetical protein